MRRTEPDTDLAVVAAEMKAAAKANPTNLLGMSPADIVAAGFPAALRRKVVIYGHDYIVQFSHDTLSSNKEMVHLSCSQESLQMPGPDIQDVLRKFFFDDYDRSRAITGVVVFPGMLGSHVLHMGYIRSKS